LANGIVLFVATGATTGQELWRTNGTPAGTFLVQEIVAGSANANIEDLQAAGNLAFFTAVDGVHGRELWITDGNAVSMVKDNWAGSADGVVAYTLEVVSGTGLAVFAGSNGTT